KRCPVWINPCSRGQPIIGANSRPEQCHLHTPCSPNYYCHVGFDSETTVCCPGGADPCTLPMTQGTGPHVLNRWYFDSFHRRCERFVYK
ncbi:Protein Y43F8B.3 a, partial [Aphelenchoides avenae]